MVMPSRSATDCAVCCRVRWDRIAMAHSFRSSNVAASTRIDAPSASAQLWRFLGRLIVRISNGEQSPQMERTRKRGIQSNPEELGPRVGMEELPRGRSWAPERRPDLVRICPELIGLSGG